MTRIRVCGGTDTPHADGFRDMAIHYSADNTESWIYIIGKGGYLYRTYSRLHARERLHERVASQSQFS
jgi:hypothetical protein